MPAFDVTTNPTKLAPLKPGDKTTIVVTATSRLPRPVTGRAMSVVVPDSFRNLVKPPAVAQKLFGQAGATQEFQFTVEIPADAKAGSCTSRFDVVDIDNKDDNFGQSSALRLEIVQQVIEPVIEKKKFKWWIPVVIGVVVIGIGLAAWKLLSGGGNKMPDVTHMSFDAAKQLLDQDSIRVVRVDTLNQDTTAFKANVVIDQTPSGGSKLNKDSNSVRLVVQQPFTVVPALARQNPNQAANTLGQAGLNFNAFSSCTNDASFNGVVMQLSSPPAGTLLARAATVSFYVGAFQPTTCPRIRRDVRIEIGRTMIVAPAPVASPRAVRPNP